MIFQDIPMIVRWAVNLAILWVLIDSTLSGAIRIATAIIGKNLSKITPLEATVRLVAIVALTLLHMAWVYFLLVFICEYGGFV